MTKKLDPYFPFEQAVEAFGRTFSALGIKYRGGTMTLDLLDRKGNVIGINTASLGTVSPESWNC